MVHRRRSVSTRSSSEPAGARGGAYVTFEPGARSAWHTHPLGQTLIVTAGSGLHQRWADRSRRSDRATSSVPARREALARRAPTDGDDPHRDPGSARRQARRRGWSRSPTSSTVEGAEIDARNHHVRGRRCPRSRMSPTPSIVEPTDAIIRIIRACICGSDLWPYNGGPERRRARAWATRPSASSRPSAATSARIKRGQVVIMPFAIPTAPACSARKGCRPPASTSASSATAASSTARRRRRCGSRLPTARSTRSTSARTTR